MWNCTNSRIFELQISTNHENLLSKSKNYSDLDVSFSWFWNFCDLTRRLWHTLFQIEPDYKIEVII